MTMTILPSPPVPCFSKPCLHCRRWPIIVIAVHVNDDAHQSLLFRLVIKSVSAHHSSYTGSEQGSRWLSIGESYSAYAHDRRLDVGINSLDLLFLVRTYTCHTWIISHKQDVGKSDTLNSDNVPIVHVPHFGEEFTMCTLVKRKRGSFPTTRSYV